MPTFFSTLTPGEVAKAAFDDSTQTLRTSINAVIAGVQQEVSINAQDDSIRVYQSDGASLRVYVDNFASLSISLSAGSTVTVANPFNGTVFQGTNPWIVGGTVTVANPGGGGSGGTVTVANPVTVVGITGTIPVSQGSSFQVEVGNFPASQGVTFGVASVTFPAVAVQAVTFPATAVQAVTFTGVTINNFPAFPAVQAVTFPVQQAIGVTGSVGVTFPVQQSIGVTGPVSVTQGGSFSVLVGNLPAVQAVTFPVNAGPVSVTQGGSFSVLVGNLPATQAVTFTGVTVLNFPATQPVSGSVSVSNFPAVQSVTLPIGLTVFQGTNPWITTSTILGGTVTIANPAAAGATTTIAALPTMSDRGTTGFISAAGGTLSIATPGCGGVYVNIQGTWVGTIIPEVQAGDGAWNNIGFVPPLGTLNSAVTSNQSFFAPIGGAAQFRLRASAFTSGTAVIAINASAASQSQQVFNLTPSTLMGMMQTTDTTGNIFRLNAVDTANSSTANLAIGATFTGTFTDALAWSNITVAVMTDQASATDGLVVEWSAAGVVANDSDTFTIPANNGQQIALGRKWRYFRIRYVNGAVATTSFALQTLLHSQTPVPSTHRAGDNITGQQDGQLVIAAPARIALTPGSPTFVILGTATSLAVAANASRKGLRLVNVSANRIALAATGSTAVLDAGIVLMPFGGVWNMDEMDFTTNAIQGIASGVTSRLAIQEFSFP